MSKYYTPFRTRDLYEFKVDKPFKISRSKIELFHECPRCFYLDRKLGVARPPGFPFSLNSAVDKLLKQEFDIYRAKGNAHPLIEKYGIDARPIPHKDLNQWRHNFTGIRYLHSATNLMIFGAIDDLWQNSRGEFIVVDYKATAKEQAITELNQDWHGGYKRQMEIYQWLLRKNGYEVSDAGYFVYCNGKTDRRAFDARLEFDVTLIPYRGDDSWIEDSLLKLQKCLQSKKIPKAKSGCDYCRYTDAIKTVIQNY